MRSGTWAAVAMGMLGLVGAVGCKKPVPELDPKSGYAKLRPGLLKAVTGFPADPEKLPRCAPHVGHVVLLTLREAAAGLTIPLAKPQPRFTTQNVRTYADEHLVALEQKDFAAYNYGSFEGATRFAIFSVVAATAPTMTECVKVPNLNLNQPTDLACKLTRGSIDGSLVVFEPTGAPTCAVRLQVEGPYGVAGSTGVLGDLCQYIHEVLRSMLEGETWLAKVAPGGKYAVTIDGAVVRAAPER